MNAAALREAFLSFFEERGHARVPSSSLVPADDPTLLFTNAGMVQFKNVFLGLEARPYAAAVTVQKCMRVSGKHNDLENVGPSPRHHTFFGMLGNFSFGAYFKTEAIRHAWSFVTGTLAVDPRRLVLTVHDADDEAEVAWRAVDGVRPDQILRMGDKTNFWAMGEVGPCGPTSELHYDWGPAACTCGRPDCSVALDNGCLRWLEIWNLVFMQFEQRPDGSRVPLRRPGVDTGMGLERIASVMVGKNDNYATDLFLPILDRIEALAGHTTAQRAAHEIAYRVIADHSRAAAFLVADGVVPGNEGRAYVLRMVLRRAMRYGRKAGFEGRFLADVADAVVTSMGAAYPDTLARRDFVRRVIEAEEDRFAQTLQSGLVRLEEAVTAAISAGGTRLPGEDAFRLYDTYGFPREMTLDAVREAGLEVDWEGFDAAMARQRERARAGGEFRARSADDLRALAETAPPATFVGYDALTADAEIAWLQVGGARSAVARDGDEIAVVLDRTPFYAEAGGQVGDTGTIMTDSGEVAISDTSRLVKRVIVHRGTVRRGEVREGQQAIAAVDAVRRAEIRRHHTATHLLHKALRETLGENARQAGSLVAPDRLRFDYQALEAPTTDQLAAIERRVNEKILEALPVATDVLPYREAVARGAMALFGEKYGDDVRMVSAGEYSRELCGGTHVQNTSEAGSFYIASETAVAAGVRRIEAVAGQAAVARAGRQARLLRELEGRLKATGEELPSRVDRLQERLRAAERAAEEASTRSAAGDFDRIASARVEVDGVPLYAGRLDGVDADALRAAADRVRDRVGTGVIVLGGAHDDRVALLVMVTKDLTARINAGEVIRPIASVVGGNGGGRPELAQAGGKDVARLDEALRGAADVVAGLLGRAR
ncbi:MAG: alanine--tRNA ligase [Armatimonadetes bacterium]|nr:alanine--tRNA ligase [Armatimonadota bacterium]